MLSAFADKTGEEIDAMMSIWREQLQTRTPDLKKMEQELARVKAFIDAKTKAYHQYVAAHGNLKRAAVIAIDVYRNTNKTIDEIIDETAKKQSEESRQEHAILKLRTKLEQLATLLEEGPQAAAEACKVYRGHFGPGS